ncbi:hypothetical protein ACMD2_05197 [Ananas comosus]|uniref:Bifunctional inhibitor/plant lipid transfer protein/seed storage helical domain-containing protein n=1 Tax=Ananas comosus TaxID=4615 RepID=A0A199USG6_ANACO|nr:hypothetical protein ACMD2_05197 [Ananas comosus]
MAKTTSCFAALVFVLIAILFCHATDAQCPDQWTALKKDCMQFVRKASPAPLPPSQQCCKTVQKSNLTCACKHVDKDLLKKISMQKVVTVAKDCGCPLKPGSKCGDYTVPPSLGGM